MFPEWFKWCQWLIWSCSRILNWKHGTKNWLKKSLKITLVDRIHQVCEILTGFWKHFFHPVDPIHIYNFISNPFHVTNLFWYPPKTSENQRFYDIFRGYQKKSGAFNGLTVMMMKVFPVARDFIESLVFVIWFCILYWYCVISSSIRYFCCWLYFL